MTIKQFAQDMMSDLETYCNPTYMTRADAFYNLKRYQEEGRKLPMGINAKNFADAWNDLLHYKTYNVFVVIKAGITVQINATSLQDAEDVVTTIIEQGEFFNVFQDEVTDQITDIFSDSDSASVALVEEPED